MSTKKIIKESLKKLVERRIDFTDYQQEDAQRDAEWFITNINDLSEIKQKKVTQINSLNEYKQNLLTQLESLTSEVERIDVRLTGYEEDLNILRTKYGVEI
jgi:hypothetical protein